MKSHTTPEKPKMKIQIPKREEKERKTSKNIWGLIANHFNMYNEFC